MSFVVILLFFAMVLSPCVVALWGRSRENAREDEPEAIIESAQEQEVAGSLPAMFAAQRLIGRMITKVRKGPAAPHCAPDAFADLAPPTLVVETPMAETTPLSLEELLREAMESAHIARAASLRADAAASGAAARIAAVRVEAAAEAARRAHVDADAAEEAALSAQSAYETASEQARWLEEPRQSIRLVKESKERKDRRAA